MDILQVASSFASDVLAYTGYLFTDLGLAIVAIIGIPLSFWVIKKTISLVRAK